MSYSDIFNEVYKDSMEKMNQEYIKHQDTWLSASISELEYHLNHHITKTGKIIEDITSYKDLLDVINYCFMICYKLKEVL